MTTSAAQNYDNFSNRCIENLAKLLVENSQYEPNMSVHDAICKVALSETFNAISIITKIILKMVSMKSESFIRQNDVFMTLKLNNISCGTV